MAQLLVLVCSDCLWVMGPFLFRHQCRGKSRISGKGVHMYTSVLIRFADFISVFISYENELIWSLETRISFS